MEAGIIPLILDNAVHVWIGSGKERCVAGAGDGRGVVIAAIDEICASVQQHIEPAFGEFRAESLEIVIAKLVDDNDDHELRPHEVFSSLNFRKSRRDPGWEKITKELARRNRKSRRALRNTDLRKKLLTTDDDRVFFDFDAVGNHPQARWTPICG